MGAWQIQTRMQVGSKYDAPTAHLNSTAYVNCSDTGDLFDNLFLLSKKYITREEMHRTSKRESSIKNCVQL